jgi:chemotaxis protein CheD
LLNSPLNPKPPSTITATLWDALKKTKFRTYINACTQFKEMAYITTQPSQMSPKMEEVRVDMADMKAENRPIELITSVGSCVAICLYDSKNKCGGLAHIMLPNSAIAPQELLPSKFANTAVPALADLIKRISGFDSPLSAKIAGGANMFPNLKNNALNIGAKNVEAVKQTLCQHKIKLIGEDVGGSHGRRITFNLGTGNATVKCFNGETRQL